MRATPPALGFIELSSISRGLFLTDTILKKAPVRVITSQPVSSGKHVILFIGDVACVEESHRAALEATDGCLLQKILIPGVHPQLAPFLDSPWSAPSTRIGEEDSIGIVESKTLAGALLAADSALKAADVQLCRMRLGQGIGGKAYFVLKGRQEELEAALGSAESSLQACESFCRTDLIPRPDPEALDFF